MGLEFGGGLRQAGPDRKSFRNTPEKRQPKLNSGRTCQKLSNRMFLHVLAN